MDKIEVTVAHSKVSRRTKNRVKENGPLFETIKTHESVFDGRPWILLRSFTTEWKGWLPTEEIEIAHV